MVPSDVLETVEILETAEVRVWVAGGWGVDALVGDQTRDHEDLDLAFPDEQEPEIMTTLESHGFALYSDWRPVKFVLADSRGRRVDLHPVRFDADGNGVQANVGDAPPFCYPAHGFTHGVIGGRRVACIGVDVQMRFHQGYEPRDVDRHDLSLLLDVARLGASDAR